MRDNSGATIEHKAWNDSRDSNFPELINYLEEKLLCLKLQGEEEEAKKIKERVKELQEREVEVMINKRKNKRLALIRSKNIENSDSEESRINYRGFVASLTKKGEKVIEDMTPGSAELLHAGVGISGEAGEILDCIKKHVIYNKELDVENIIEELGDLEFFMEMVRQNVGISREETIQENIKKLKFRYPKGKYSNSQAQERKDKVK